MYTISVNNAGPDDATNVEVEDDVADGAEEPVVERRQVPCDLSHEGSVRVGRDAGDVHAAGRVMHDE